MDPAAQIPLAMLLVFASAKILAEIFERMGQPGIVGEILAGVLIGPHVLGWLAPSEFLHTLSDLGVMFLLFRVGLEIKSSELMKVSGIALLVALAGSRAAFLRRMGNLHIVGRTTVGKHLHRGGHGGDQRRHHSPSTGGARLVEQPRGAGHSGGRRDR